jgi:hypothetical protein
VKPDTRRRYVAFLGSLMAALVISVPPQSVALQGPQRLRRAERGASGSTRQSAAFPEVRRSPDGARRPPDLRERPPDDSLRAAAPGTSGAGDTLESAAGGSIAVTVQVVMDQSPRFFRFALEQNYPNPCQGSTVIRYATGRPTHFTIAVYSILGQRVATLVDRDHDPGEHSVRWGITDDDGRPVRPGVYIYRAAGGGFSRSKKLVIR